MRLNVFLMAARSHQFNESLELNSAVSAMSCRNLAAGNPFPPGARTMFGICGRIGGAVPGLGIMFL